MEYVKRLNTVLGGYDIWKVTDTYDEYVSSFSDEDSFDFIINHFNTLATENAALHARVAELEEALHQAERYIKFITPDGSENVPAPAKSYPMNFFIVDTEAYYPDDFAKGDLYMVESAADPLYATKTLQEALKRIAADANGRPYTINHKTLEEFTLDGCDETTAPKLEPLNVDSSQPLAVIKYLIDNGMFKVREIAANMELPESDVWLSIEYLSDEGFVSNEMEVRHYVATQAGIEWYNNHTAPDTDATEPILFDFSELTEEEIAHAEQLAQDLVDDAVQPLDSEPELLCLPAEYEIVRMKEPYLGYQLLYSTKLRAYYKTDKVWADRDLATKLVAGEAEEIIKRLTESEATHGDA